MDIKFVIAIILMVELTGVYGFYIIRTEENNSTDVYKVKEDETTNTLTFINPKLDNKTRREIIFYHVIETPYNQDKIVNEHVIEDANESAENDLDEIHQDHGKDSDDDSIESDHEEDKQNLPESDEADDSDTSSKEVMDEYINEDNEADTDSSEIPEVDVRFADVQQTGTNGHGHQISNKDAEKKNDLNQLHNESVSVNISSPVNNVIPGNTADKSDLNHLNNQSKSVNVSNPVKDAIPEVTTFAHSYGKIDRHKLNKESESVIISNPATDVIPEHTTDSSAKSDLNNLNNQSKSVNVSNPVKDAIPKVTTYAHLYGKIDRHKLNNESKSVIISNPATDVIPEHTTDLSTASLEKVRRKRDVIDPPELPELNLNLLPDYINAILSTEKPNTVNKYFLHNMNHDKLEDQKEKAENKVDETSNREGRSVSEGKTYGMRLTGDSGVVWNDINDKKILNSVGDTNKIEDIKESVKSSNIDEEKIDKMITTFESLESKKDNDLKNHDENISLRKFSNDNEMENPTHGLIEKDDTSIKNNTDKINLEENDIKTNDLLKEDTLTEFLQHSPKTYGIRLTGNSGIMWNHLNGQRVSYSDKPNTDHTKEEPSQDRINVSVETILENDNLDQKDEIYDDMESEETSNEENVLEDTTDHPATEETSNEENVLEDTTDHPATEEPTTLKQKHLKTYGMKLTGDHGEVWNDLNDKRVAYHVGTNEETENDKREREKYCRQLTYYVDISTCASMLGIKTNMTEENTTTGSDIETTTATQDSYETFEDTNEPYEYSDESTTPDSIDIRFDSEKNDANEKENEKKVKDITKEILNIIKEVFINETEKLHNFKNNCNSSVNNKDNNNVTHFEVNKIENNTKISPNKSPKIEDKKEDNNSTDVSSDQKDEGNKTSQGTHDIQAIMKNEEFWIWLNDWTTLYIELLMHRIDDHIKDEVTKQIKEHFANQTNGKPGTEINNNNQNTTDKQDSAEGKNNKIENKINGTAELNDTLLNPEADINKDATTKKRKDKDSDDKNIKKEDLVRIEATTMYGNSVDNEKVTNIFIFHIGNKTDLDNIQSLSNGSNDVYVFGNKDKKPEQNIESDVKKEQKPEESKVDISPNKEQVDRDKIDTVKVTNTKKPENESKGKEIESTSESVQINNATQAKGEDKKIDANKDTILNSPIDKQKETNITSESAKEGVEKSPKPVINSDSDKGKEADKSAEPNTPKDASDKKNNSTSENIPSDKNKEEKDKKSKENDVKETEKPKNSDSEEKPAVSEKIE